MGATEREGSDYSVIFLFVAGAAIGFGAWQDSFGAGFWMFVVLFTLVGVCDQVEEAAKRYRR